MMCQLPQKAQKAKKKIEGKSLLWMMLQEQQLVGNGKSLAASNQHIFQYKVVTGAITEKTNKGKTQHLYFKEMN